MDDKKKRAEVVKEEMKDANAMLKTLERAIFVQQDEMDKLNPKKSDDDFVESNETSSGYNSLSAKRRLGFSVKCN